VVERINAEVDEAVAAGLLHPDGRYSLKGASCYYGVQVEGADCPDYKRWKGYRRFVIRHAVDTAEGGLWFVGLPDEFTRAFPYSGQWVVPVAIVAHEIGHTRYGSPMEAGREVGLAAELEVTDEYENPMRLMYGYPARERYCSGAVGCGDSPRYRGTVDRREVAQGGRGMGR